MRFLESIKRPSIVLAAVVIVTVICAPSVRAQQVSAARDALLEQFAELGLSQADVADIRVSSAYVDRLTGRSYVYLVQTYQGVDVHNALATIVVSPDGKAQVTGDTI